MESTKNAKEDVLICGTRERKQGKGREERTAGDRRAKFLLLHLVRMSLGPVLRNKASALVMRLYPYALHVCSSVDPLGL